MSTELVAETIERWAELRREYESAAYPQGVDRVRNWLFGAGMALQLLDDDKLFGLSRRALHAGDSATAAYRSTTKRTRWSARPEREAAAGESVSWCGCTWPPSGRPKMSAVDIALWAIGLALLWGSAAWLAASIIWRDQK